MRHHARIARWRRLAQNLPVLALSGLLFMLFNAGCSRTSAAPRRGGSAGVPVVTKRVSKKDVPVEVQAIGNVEAYNTVTVQSQVTGQLTEVFFHEGDFVKKGDHLFTIDPRPFRAALDQAEANLARDQALLVQAEAQLDRDIAQAKYSRLTADHNTELSQNGIVSKDSAEQYRAAASASDATVKADDAMVKSARAALVAQQAAVETAKLQLAYTVIQSPIDGRTGNLNIKPGNLVAANSTQLITIQQIDPVFVTFSVPAMHLTSIKHFMAQSQLPVVATPQGSTESPATGSLSFVDNLVDASTDTIKLKATLNNADRRLWPGQFVRVSVHLTKLSDATVVPNEAVQTGQDGQYVFVVKADSTVEQRAVSVGPRADRDMVIEKGLTAGEIVVTEGQMRLEPGSHVQMDGGHGGRGERGGDASGRANRPS